MSDIITIGSLNMDLVVRVEKMPKPGETVRGGDLMTIPGGKGANQAAAAALLGNQVAMIGKVGKDEFGSTLTSTLNRFGVDTTEIAVDPDAVTGTAMITVDEKGENSIVISPGANGQVKAEDILCKEWLIQKAKIILLQLEIPLEAIECAIDLAQKNHVKVVLNPAPAMDLPASIFNKVDYLIPNETEAARLTGCAVRDIDSAEAAARKLISYGVQAVIVTLGEKGSLLVDCHQVVHVPACKVAVVDSTAAGDAFIGGFASALLKGFSPAEAVRFANCTGALAVTKKGAQSSLPVAEEVNRLFVSLYS